MKSHANDANNCEQKQLDDVRCRVMLEVPRDNFEIKNTNNEEIEMQQLNEMQQLYSGQTASEEASTLLSSSSREKLDDQVIDVNNFLPIRWLLSLTSLIDYR